MSLTLRGISVQAPGPQKKPGTGVADFGRVPPRAAVALSGVEEHYGPKACSDSHCQISAELTAVLAAEATAAYLFGLSVGLTVRSLPDRLDD